MIESKAVGEAWRRKLVSGGYEHIISNERECRVLKKLPRLWRRITKKVKLDISASDHKSVFEVGCGGGKHLVPFLLNGWRAVGNDVSKEVLDRARAYINSITKVCGTNLNVSFAEGDFFDYETSEKFDVVFHAGVIEHFLNDEERLKFLKKMCSIAKPGGYIISVVPSGTHPLRLKMKKTGLGGYDIPEIDYTPELIVKEFASCGCSEIEVLPHNLMNHLLLEKGILFPLKKIFFLMCQIFPISLLPQKFASRYAGTFIGIAKKPVAPP